MQNFTWSRIATHDLLLLLSLFVLFHFTILLGIVPFEMEWGGRLKNLAQMLSFESFSILANLVMLAVIGIKAGLVRIHVHPKMITAALWILFALFLLNTLENALSTNELEKLLFNLVALLLSFFSLVLALSKEQKPSLRQLAQTVQVQNRLTYIALFCSWLVYMLPIDQSMLRSFPQCLSVNIFIFALLYVLPGDDVVQSFLVRKHEMHFIFWHL